MLVGDSVMDLGLRNRRFIITGASQGIGAQAAAHLAREGADLILLARSSAKLLSVVAGLKQFGGSYLHYACDLAQSGAPTQIAKTILTDGHTVDGIVHNLGGTLAIKPAQSSIDDWNKVIHFNVGIGIELNGILVPHFVKNNFGRIVHVSSISAEALRGSAPYAASKALLNAYVKVLGRELGTTNVVVSAVMPGAVVSEGGHWDTVSKTKPGMKADFLRHHHACGRLGTAEEIAPFITFLCSDVQMTFAQGAIINVDGGTM